MGSSSDSSERCGSRIVRFRPGRTLILVPVVLRGPRGRSDNFRFVLDTGTTTTMIATDIAERLGFSARDAV